MNAKKSKKMVGTKQWTRRAGGMREAQGALFSVKEGQSSSLKTTSLKTTGLRSSPDTSLPQTGVWERPNSIAPRIQD